MNEIIMHFLMGLLFIDYASKCWNWPCFGDMWCGKAGVCERYLRISDLTMVEVWAWVSGGRESAYNGRTGGERSDSQGLSRHIAPPHDHLASFFQTITTQNRRIIFSEKYIVLILVLHKLSILYEPFHFGQSTWCEKRRLSIGIWFSWLAGFIVQLAEIATKPLPQ